MLSFSVFVIVSAKK